MGSVRTYGLLLAFRLFLQISVILAIIGVRSLLSSRSGININTWCSDPTCSLGRFCVFFSICYFWFAMLRLFFVPFLVLCFPILIWKYSLLVNFLSVSCVFFVHVSFVPFLDMCLVYHEELVLTPHRRLQLSWRYLDRFHIEGYS